MKHLSELQQAMAAKTQLTRQLEDKVTKLTNIIEGANLGTWEWDIKTRNLTVNDQWANMLGYTLDEVQPLTIDKWGQLLHPKDLIASNKIIEKHFQGIIQYYENDVRMKHKDGKWRWIRTRGKVTQRDASGQALKMFGIHTDITVEYEKTLELEQFFYVNLDLLCIVDIEGYFMKINKAWEDILGYPVAELKGRNIFEFIHPEDKESTLESLAHLKNGQNALEFVNRYIGAKGDYHYIEWRSAPYEGKIYAAARDITERIRYEEKILEISNRDALTNIYNRRYVFQRAKEILAEYKRVKKEFSVCIIDIDYFKRVNDRYGHQGGDYILQEFTSLINENLRSYDILGRYGGEEFIIILTNRNKKEGSRVIQRILAITRDEKFHYNGNDIQITFSAGISDASEFTVETISIDHLVELADQRMYQAKNLGRNQIIYQEVKDDQDEKST